MCKANPFQDEESEEPAEASNVQLQVSGESLYSQRREEARAEG